MTTPFSEPKYLTYVTCLHIVHNLRRSINVSMIKLQVCPKIDVSSRLLLKGNIFQHVKVFMYRKRRANVNLSRCERAMFPNRLVRRYRYERKSGAKAVEAVEAAARVGTDNTHDFKTFQTFSFASLPLKFSISFLAPNLCKLSSKTFRSRLGAHVLSFVSSSLSARISAFK